MALRFDCTASVCPALDVVFEFKLTHGLDLHHIPGPHSPGRTARQRTSRLYHNIVYTIRDMSVLWIVRQPSRKYDVERAHLLRDSVNTCSTIDSAMLLLRLLFIPASHITCKSTMQLAQMYAGMRSVCKVTRNAFVSVCLSPINTLLTAVELAPTRSGLLGTMCTRSNCLRPAAAPAASPLHIA